MQQGKIAPGSQSDKIQTVFNYQCGLIQNFTPVVAYQGFSPDLGWASQPHGTKFDHEMSPKYWSNSCPRGKHLRQLSSVSQWSLKKLRKEINTCHLAAIRLQPLPTVSPGETQVEKAQLRCISKEWFQWVQTLKSSHTKKGAKFLNLRYLVFFY